MCNKISLNRSLLILVISSLLITSPVYSWSFSDLTKSAQQSWQRTKQAASNSYQKVKQTVAPELARAQQAAAQKLAQAKQIAAPVIARVQQTMTPELARAKQIANNSYQKVTQAAAPVIARVKQVGAQGLQKASTIASDLKQTAETMIADTERDLNRIKNEVSGDFDLVKSPVKVSLRAKFNTENARKNTPSQVYVGPTLNPGEQSVIQQRLPLVQHQLAKMLTGKLPANITLNNRNLPRIGIVASGGGYRAMIATLGFLMGLEKIGVLDAALYMSALSGSTWLLAPWTSLNMSLTDTNTYLSQYSANAQQIFDPITEQTQIQKTANNVTRKMLFDNPLSSIDLYGALIANKVFGSLPQRQNVYLADQAAIVQNGSRIFPIYTAVEPVAKNQYRWYEFTPFTFGSADLNHYIDSWAIGRLFQNGQARALPTLDGSQYGPDMPLGFILGICGSAFTVSVDEMINLMSKAPLNRNQLVALNMLKMHTEVLDSGDQRFYPALVPNFTAGMASSALAQTKELKLVDAGLDSNLPFLPLVDGRRNLDILIALDASNPIEAGKALMISEQRARERGYKFPKIDYSQLDQKSFSVFTDPDPNTPTVIYVPLIRDNSLPGLTENAVLSNFDPQVCANTSFCSTFNFKYSAAQFEQLRQSAEFNVVANGDNFWQAVVAAVVKKNS